MKKWITALACLMLTMTMLPAALGAEDLTAEFERAAAELLTPAQEALQTGTYALHMHDTAYVPSVAPDITPFDEMEQQVLPPVAGTFATSDESVVTVDANGRMTGVGLGSATVTYETVSGTDTFQVTVSEEAPPELAKNMVYVARREYYKTQRKRLPKYNEYAKWYYGKKKEVGWCSVFTIFCANASGSDPVKLKAIPETLTDEDVLYLREGQVGHQYDGFWKTERFSNIPRPGYLVIYADMKKGYRTTHIGIVVDAQDRGDGVYAVTTVEGNMSNTVKSYCYLYDSKVDNSTVGKVKKQKLQNNMSELPADEQTDPLLQYDLHTDHWSVFGFCGSWK